VASSSESKALGGGTTFEGDYSGQILMVTVATPGCSFVETLTGAVKITLDDPTSATGTVEVREKAHDYVNDLWQQPGGRRRRFSQRSAVRHAGQPDVRGSVHEPPQWR
jgi:hypothetical protein